MKVPLKWLEDYVPLTFPVAELAERLTLAGLEVSGVRLIGVPPPEGLRVKAEEAGPVWDRDKVVVAQVVTVEKHPNADKLKLPTVDYGQGRTKKMVTGAPNLNVGDSGQKVVLALAGSVLYDGHATPKKLAELKPGNIRGEPSDAMVCSTYELGIDEEHEGIILLEDDAPVGTPLADFMGDVVLELDVLPNMARCLSMIGVAREVAALTGQALKLPPHDAEASGESIEGQVRVVIEDPKLSARYAAMLLRSVKIGPAPGWMQRRLSYAGMRPINNVVDITNYVMLEWGQPLHAFDYDKLVARAGGKAPTITVRPARPGETLKTLDGVDRKLTPDMLVIADTAGPIALAGVMGGAETEVSAATTNVLLESANFDFLNIRRTIKALNLPSEASTALQPRHPSRSGAAGGRARGGADAPVRRGDGVQGDRRRVPRPAAAAGRGTEDVGGAPYPGHGPAGGGGGAPPADAGLQGRGIGAGRAAREGSATPARHPGRRRRPDRGPGPAARLRPPAGHASGRPAASADRQPGPGVRGAPAGPARHPRPAGGDQLRSDDAGARGAARREAGRLRPPAQPDQQRARGDAAERSGQRAGRRGGQPAP